MQQKSTRDAGSVEELSGALLRASRVLVGVASRSLADTEGAVTITQFRMLAALEGQEDVSLVRLADRLEVTPSTAHRMVERLVRSELVTRSTNTSDRRQVLLALSASGRELVARVVDRRRRELARIARLMPAETRAAAVAALEAFSLAAGEPEPGGPWGLDQRPGL